MPERITLQKEQLLELTGHSQPGRMVRWLSERGWVFEPPQRRGDIPKVDLEYYRNRMSGKAAAPRRAGPSLDFFVNGR